MAMTGYSMTSGKTNMTAPLGYGNGLEFAARTVIYVTIALSDGDADGPKT